MNGPAVMSPATLPRVDVIVPCYGYGHVLEQSVDSVCLQQGVDVRVIVVDDASPDATATVAARLAARDSRVEVVRHEHNRGHIATFNHGLSLADAEYVMVLSADDRLTPHALARGVDVMRHHPRVGFVYGRAQHFRDRWRRPPQVPLGVAVWPGDQWVRQRCRRAVNVISSPEVLVRTEVHRRVGDYEPTLPHTADLHLWLRLASVADVAYLRGRTQAGYRVHAASLQRTVHAGALTDVTERVAMFRHLAAHAWLQRPDVGDLMHWSLTALAHEAAERARRLHERGLHDEAGAFEFVAHDAWPVESGPPPRTTPRPPVASVTAGVARRLRRHTTQLRREVLGT